MRRRSMIPCGLYGEQVRRGLDSFPREQWLFLDFHEFVRNHRAVLDRTTQFLELSPFARDPRLPIISGDTGRPGRPAAYPRGHQPARGAVRHRPRTPEPDLRPRRERVADTAGSRRKAHRGGLRGPARTQGGSRQLGVPPSRGGAHLAATAGAATIGPAYSDNVNASSAAVRCPLNTAGPMEVPTSRAR